MKYFKTFGLSKSRVESRKVSSEVEFPRLWLNNSSVQRMLRNHVAPRMSEIEYPFPSSRSTCTEQYSPTYTYTYTSAGIRRLGRGFGSALDPWLEEFNFKKSCSVGNRYAAPLAIILTTHAASNTGFIAGFSCLHSSIIWLLSKRYGQVRSHLLFFLLIIIIFLFPIVENQQFFIFLFNIIIVLMVLKSH